jgi:YggT family protein
MSQIHEETEIQEVQEQTEVRTSQREIDQEQRIFTFKATQLIWLALGLLEGLIAMRVMLKLIGANPENPFAVFIYGVSDIFLFPFEGLVGTPASGGMVLEISSIIAMLVYALLFWAMERIVWVIFYRPRGSTVGVTQTTTSEPAVVRKRTTRQQGDM